MTGRSPARLLAPLALVVTALALVVVLSSSGEGGSPAREAENRPAATPAATSTKERSADRKRRTYTVKSGDTPSAIAEKTGVPLDKLLELNPDVDPQLLSPGQKLKLQ